MALSLGKTDLIVCVFTIFPNGRAEMVQLESEVRALKYTK